MVKKLYIFSLFGAIIFLNACYSTHHIDHPSFNSAHIPFVVGDTNDAYKQVSDVMRVMQLVFNPTKNLIAYEYFFNGTRSIGIYHYATKKLIHYIKNAQCATFDPQGTYFACAAFAPHTVCRECVCSPHADLHSIHIFKIDKTGMKLHAQLGHYTIHYPYPFFSRDGKYIYSFENGKTLKGWNLLPPLKEKGKKLFTISQAVDQQSTAIIPHTACLALLNNTTKSLNIIDIAKPLNCTLLKQIRLPHTIDQFITNNMGTLIATQEHREPYFQEDYRYTFPVWPTKSTIQLWDIKTEKVIKECTLEYHEYITQTAFSPDDTLFAFGGYNKKESFIKIFRVKDWQLILHGITRGVGNINALTFTPDNQTVITAGHGVQLKSWNIPSVFKHHKNIHTLKDIRLYANAQKVLWTSNHASAKLVKICQNRLNEPK